MRAAPFFLITPASRPFMPLIQSPGLCLESCLRKRWGKSRSVDGRAGFKQLMATFESARIQTAARASSFLGPVSVFFMSGPKEKALGPNGN